MEKPKMFVYNDQGEVLDFAPEVYHVVAPEMILTSEFSNISNHPIAIDWDRIFNSYLKLSDEFIFKFMSRVSIDHIITRENLSEKTLDKLLTIKEIYKETQFDYTYAKMLVDKNVLSLDLIRKHKDKIAVEYLINNIYYPVDEIVSIYGDQLTLEKVKGSYGYNIYNSINTNPIMTKENRLIQHHLIVNEPKGADAEAVSRYFDLFMTEINELPLNDYVEFMRSNLWYMELNKDKIDWTKISISLDKFIDPIGPNSISKNIAADVNWDIVPYDKLLDEMMISNYTLSISTHISFRFRLYFGPLVNYINWEALNNVIKSDSKYKEFKNEFYQMYTDYIDKKDPDNWYKEQLMVDEVKEGPLVDVPYEKKPRGIFSKLFKRN